MVLVLCIPQITVAAGLFGWFVADRRVAMPGMGLELLVMFACSCQPHVVGLHQYCSDDTHSCM
jgi:hypothetical protein